MYVYAVESLQKHWYTGAKHINIKSRDSKGIISLWQSPEAEPLVGVWGKAPHKDKIRERSLLQSALRLSVGRCPHTARAFSPWKSFY